MRELYFFCARGVTVDQVTGGSRTLDKLKGEDNVR